VIDGVIRISPAASGEFAGAPLTNRVFVLLDRRNQVRVVANLAADAGWDLQVARANARAFLISADLQPLLRRCDGRREQERYSDRKRSECARESRGASEFFEAGSDAIRHWSEVSESAAEREQMAPGSVRRETQLLGPSSTASPERAGMQNTTNELAKRFCCGYCGTALRTGKRENSVLQSTASARGGPITSVGSVFGYGVSSGGIEGSTVTFVRVSPRMPLPQPIHLVGFGDQCSDR